MEIKNRSQSGSNQPTGWFVGLSTLDVAQYVSDLPTPNQKITARFQEISGGGPALNAAVIFAALGGKATLITALGDGPIANMIRADLNAHGVEIIDCAAKYSPALSSILVDLSNGDRQVISTDGAGGSLALVPLENFLSTAPTPNCVLIDGHHRLLAKKVLTKLRTAAVPVVADAGRWKPAFTDLLPQVTHLVCAADFLPPWAHPAPTSVTQINQGNDFTLLRQLKEKFNIGQVAQTRGPDPILLSWKGQDTKLAVPVIKTRCTLGAGDFFHGALAYQLALNTQCEFPKALEIAAQIAAIKCTQLGTRTWLSDPMLTKFRQEN